LSFNDLSASKLEKPVNDTRPHFKRILLKLSGEALTGDQSFGIDPSVLKTMVSEVSDIHEQGVEVGIVIGGGNIFRGLQSEKLGVTRVSGDQMGMLATVINAIALGDAFKNIGVASRVMSALDIHGVVEPFVRQKAVHYLSGKHVVIFAAGTGNPYFTTDTAATLRALEKNRQYPQSRLRPANRHTHHRRKIMKEEILSELRDNMTKSVEALKKEFNRIRTGRASTALLDGIKVSCYDTRMPLDQVASISVPESRLILIQPWDQTILGEIEKAVLKSELGLTPMNDGKIIRISIPPLTEERRKELAKLARKMAEDSKISVRNHRREANDMFKELKNDKEISEDEMHKAYSDVQKITDDFIKKIDEITAEKEKEIVEF